MVKKGETGEARESGKIRSVDAYLKEIQRITEKEMGKFIYRGLSNINYRLNSSATRRLDTTINKDCKKSQKKEIIKRDLLSYTTKLVIDAKQKGYNYKDGRELSDLELIADLQHHGCATLLMDFTKNALVALYFACRKFEKDGYVAVIDINEFNLFNEITTENSKKNILIIEEINDENKEKRKIEKNSLEYYLDSTKDRLFFWEPPSLNNRIPAQHSIFVFGNCEINKKHYGKIVIDKNSKESILRDLNRIHDINPVTLFFDLVGYAQANSQEELFVKFEWKDYFNIGLDFQRKNENNLALNNFKEAISLINQNDKENKSTLLYFLGSTKRSLGMLEDAIVDFDEAIKLNPKYPYTYNNRGILRDELGRIDEAISDLSEAIKLDPENYLFFFNRGAIYDDNKKYVEAINDFNKSIELNSVDPKSYVRRGMVKILINKNDEAIKDFDEAARLDPKNADIYQLRGLARENLNKIEDAINDYDLAIKFDTKSHLKLFYRGLAKAKIANHEGALKDYDSTIDLNPNFAQAYNNRGLEKIYIGNYESAIEDFEKALELGPKKAIVYYNRGLARIKLDNKKDAIEDCFMAIELYLNEDNYCQIKDICDVFEIIDNVTCKLYLYRSIANWSLGDKEKSKADYDKTKELATQQDNKQVLKLLEECFNEDGSLKDNWKEVFKKQSDKSFD